MAMRLIGYTAVYWHNHQTGFDPTMSLILRTPLQHTQTPGVTRLFHHAKQSSGPSLLVKVTLGLIPWFPDCHSRAG